MFFKCLLNFWVVFLLLIIIGVIGVFDLFVLYFNFDNLFFKYCVLFYNLLCNLVEFINFLIVLVIVLVFLGVNDVENKNGCDCVFN